MAATANSANTRFGGLNTPVASQAGWITDYDVDFSGLSSQTLGSDTTFTIDGHTWTKENSANDSTALALTNGSGLVYTPAATGTIGGAIRSPPLIRSPLSGFITGFDGRMPLRLWLFISSSNEGTTNGNDGVWFGYAIINTLGDPAGLVFRAGRNAGAAQGITHRHIFYTVNTDQNITVTPLGSNSRVIAIDFPTGLLGASHSSCGTIGTANAWPALSALTPLALTTPGNADWSSNFSRSFNTEANVLIGCGRNGSTVPGAGLYVATVQKLRIDHWVGF